MLYVSSGLTIIFALILAVIGAVGAAVTNVPLASSFGLRIAVAGVGGAVLLFVVAAIDIMLGIFVWKGRSWARTITIILTAASVPISFTTGPLGTFISLVLAALMIGLLIGPRSARHYFSSMSRQSRPAYDGGQGRVAGG